jgi:large subunit ribosomal protein L14
VIDIKAITASVTKTLSPGSLLRCADNSGVKVLQIIMVFGFKGRRRKRSMAGVGNLISCRVYSGDEPVRHKVFRAVVIRQTKEYRRPNGLHVAFEDNAAVIVDEKGDPKGTFIKGPVAKEAIERFPTISKIASIIV